MSCTSDNYYQVTEDSTFLLLARIPNVEDTAYPVIADIASIAVTAYDITEDDENTAEEDLTTIELEDDSPTVASVWFNTLQTGAIWTASKDSVGYNFKYKSSLPDANKLYRIDVYIVFTNGDTRKIKWMPIKTV